MVDATTQPPAETLAECPFCGADARAALTRRAGGDAIPDKVLETIATTLPIGATDAGRSCRAGGDESHTDDRAVDLFAARMKAKLTAARAKGRGGWDDPKQCSTDYLRDLLHDHVAKGDPIDVANFCMMLDHYGASTTPKPPVDADDPDLLVGDVSVAVEYMLGKIPYLPSKGSPQFQQIVSALTRGYVFGRCSRGAA